MVGTAANALTASVDGGPTLQFSAVTSLQVNALDGDVDIALTVGALAITSINVSGGNPNCQRQTLDRRHAGRRHSRVYAYFVERWFAHRAGIPSEFHHDGTRCL